MKNIKKAYTIIEYIIAIGLVIIFISAATTSILGSTSIVRTSAEITKAKFIAQEGIEALKSIKNQNWSNITLGGPYGIEKSPNWVISGTENEIDQFTRTVYISPVRRNAFGLIVETGGTIDSNTVKITSRVEWETMGKSRDFEITSYLMNWRL